MLYWIITFSIQFSSAEEYSHILKCDSNIECTERFKNCGIIITNKVSKYPGTGTKHFRYDLHVCSDSNKHTSESDIHFHTGLVSSNVHFCLYWVKYKEFLPLSWYGKPECDGDFWMWGAYFFGSLEEGVKSFNDQIVKYKQRWSIGSHGEVKLVAFVKL